jgi:CRP/FNR family cyclic AMP-dependent transcriptional regulator
MSAPTVEELAAIPPLASLSPAQLGAETKLFTLRSYARDAIVSTEGDRVEMFNFILSGNVQAFWRDEAGHELRLGIDGPGDHFPDVVLTGEPALVSHIATADLRLASIRTTDLMELLRRHPQVGVVLLMDVVARLRRIISRTKMLTMQDVYGRVVKLLLANAVQADGELASARLTHVEIGQRVGATREMVGRVLRELTRGGYIRADGERMIILRKPPGRW